jgi:hypothetical protein
LGIVPKKIYISSTFRDLKEYRKNVFESLTPLTSAGFLELATPMEYMMPGSSQPILDQCLKFVADSDIYILVIGRNYGSVEATTGRSFTENEYRHAEDLGKTIIPFIADDNAEKLPESSADNADKYAKFKKEVLDNHLSFCNNFINPFHLSLQIITALYRFADKKWTARDDIKYFCDRSIQKLEFIQRKRKSKLNVFTLVGKEDDRADYFSKRMGKYEFGMEKEYIDTPLRSSMFIGNISRYEKHRRILIGHLMEKFLSNEEDCPETVNECFDHFTNKNINKIFINLYLSPLDTQNVILKTTLENFFKELSEGCSQHNITVYYVITFQFDNTEQVDDSIADWIIKNNTINDTKANITDIDPLPPVRLVDVKDWINKYISISDSFSPDEAERINNFLSGHFKDQNSSQNMNQTFAILSDLLKIINEKQ